MIPGGLATFALQDVKSGVTVLDQDGVGGLAEGADNVFIDIFLQQTFNLLGVELILEN